MVTRALFGENAHIVDDGEFRLLLLANVSPALGITLMSPIISSLTGPFGVAETRLGLLITAFTVPAIIIIPLAGLITGRYGRKPVLVVGLLVYGLAGSAIALTTDFRMALALRFLQGVGFSGLTPVIITSVGDLYAGDDETTAQGLRFTTTGLTQIVFGFLAGVIVVVAWQLPFLLYTIAVPTAVAILLWFEEPSDARAHRGLGSDVRDILSIAASPRVLCVLLARGVPPFLYVAFLTYNSILVVRVLDLTPAHSGVLVILGSLTSAGLASQAGRIGAWFADPWRPLHAANLLMALGFALVSVATTFPVVAVGVTVIGAGFGVSLSLYRSLITGFASDRHRGGIVSVGESIGRLGATVAPLVMAALVDFGGARASFSVAVRGAILAVAVGSGLAGGLLIAVSRRSVPVAGGTAGRAGN